MGSLGSASPIGEQGVSLPTTSGHGAHVTSTCQFPRFCRSAKEADRQQRRPPILVARVAVDSRFSALALAPAANNTDNAYLNGVVKAAWAVLLRCYTAQDQVSFSFSCDGDNDDSIVRFSFLGDAEQLSVADAVAAAGAKAPAPGTAVSQFILPGRGEVVGDTIGRDTPGAIDTVVLVTGGRNGSVLGRIPKLEVCIRCSAINS
jgi:hypothetical protein